MLLLLIDTRILISKRLLAEFIISLLSHETNRRYDRVMNERMVPVQGLVRQKLMHLGSQGEQWLAELPDLIAHLEREWAITVGRPLAGGSVSYVTSARTADGRGAVVLAHRYCELLSTQTDIEETAI
jgi:hypothetical protein